MMIDDSHKDFHRAALTRRAREPSWQAAHGWTAWATCLEREGQAGVDPQLAQAMVSHVLARVIATRFNPRSAERWAAGETLAAVAVGDFALGFSLDTLPLTATRGSAGWMLSTAVEAATDDVLVLARVGKERRGVLLSVAAGAKRSDKVVAELDEKQCVEAMTLRQNGERLLCIAPWVGSLAYAAQLAPRLLSASPRKGEQALRYKLVGLELAAELSRISLYDALCEAEEARGVVVAATAAKAYVTGLVEEAARAFFAVCDEPDQAFRATALDWITHAAQLRARCGEPSRMQTVLADAFFGLGGAR